jgi:hypothetical protein
MNECIPKVWAMRACVKERSASKFFSANITADDPVEMVARGKYVLSQFGPLGEICAFLVEGYVSGGEAITVARRNFPKHFCTTTVLDMVPSQALRLSAVAVLSSTPSFRVSLAPLASMLAPCASDKTSRSCCRTKHRVHVAASDKTSRSCCRTKHRVHVAGQWS